MAVEGYDYNRNAVEKPDTWGDFAKDTGLEVVGGLARGAGEVGQALGATEFAKATRGIERGVEEQLSPTGREVAKSAWFPGKDEEFKLAHPVRGIVHEAVNLGTSLPAFLAGRAAGAAIGGAAGSIVPGLGTAVGGVIGGALAGTTQAYGSAEYEARKQVEKLSGEQKETLPAWRDTFAQTGSAEAADEALVKALNPTSNQILHAAGGLLTGGVTSHQLSHSIGKTVAEKVAMGIEPRILPKLTASGTGREAGILSKYVGEQGGAMALQGGMDELGRQTGGINAGLEEHYDPLKIVKMAGESGVTGVGFGVHTGLSTGRAGARKAREQYDRLYEEGSGLNVGLDWEKANPLVPPGTTVAAPAAPPAGTVSAPTVPVGTRTVTTGGTTTTTPITRPATPPVTPPVGTAGVTVDPATTAGLKASTATGGGPLHDAATDTISASAHAAGEQIGEATAAAEQARKQAEAAPPVIPPVTEPVVPPVTTEVTPPVAAPPVAPVAPAPKPETWGDFRARMAADAQGGAGREHFETEYRLWSQTHNGGKPPKKDTPDYEGGHTQLSTELAVIRKQAREQREAVEKQAKLDADAVETQRKADEAEAAKAPVEPELTAEEQLQRDTEQARLNVEAREAAERAQQEADAKALGYVEEPGKVPEGTPKPVKEPVAEPTKAETAAGQARVLQGDKAKPPGEVKPTVVPEGVSGKKKRGKAAERTAETDALSFEERVNKKVEEAETRLRKVAEREHARLVKADRERMDADKARGKPRVLKTVKSVDKIHEQLIQKYHDTVTKAETAADQAKAKSAVEQRRAETEAKEEDARATAAQHLGEAEDSKAVLDAHITEEQTAARKMDDPGGKRDSARKAVIARARAFVDLLEAKIGKIGMKAGSTSAGDGKLKQNLLNSLRDTKQLIERWDIRDTEGSKKARDARRVKIDQGFSDFVEDMVFLRAGLHDELGLRREQRAKERTEAQRRVDKSVDRAAVGTMDEARVQDDGRVLTEDELAAREARAGEREARSDRAHADDTNAEGRAGPRRQEGENLEGFGIEGDHTEVSSDDSAHAMGASFTIRKKDGSKVTTTAPVLERMTGHEALRSAQNIVRKLLGKATTDTERAYLSHLLEWSGRLRGVVPHIKLEVLSNADFERIGQALGAKPGGEGFHVRSPAEMTGEVSAGRVFIPEWHLAKGADEHWLAHVIIHEFGHAATLQGLEHDAKYRGAIALLRDAYDRHVKTDRDDLVEHALSDITEFATEAPINRTMIEHMSMIEAPAAVVAYVQGLPKPTVKMNMWQAFTGALARLVGFKQPKMSLIEAMMRLNEHVLDRQQETNEARSKQFREAADERTYYDEGGASLHAIRGTPTGAGVRKGLINLVARSKASGATFADRWAATMLNAKTTMQIAQGLDYLMGKLTASHSPMAKRALDLLPTDLRLSMEGKPLMRVYSELQQRMSNRVEQLLKIHGGEDLAKKAYKYQRQFGIEGTSPDGKPGSMWDFFTKFAHDETNSEVFAGGESNAHLDPKNLDHAQALARLPDLEKRYAMLPKELQDLRREGHAFFEMSQKKMSDFLSDNVVDELTDAIRNEENKKLVKAPIFDRAGIEDFKQWLRDGRPDTHAHKDLFRDILNTGPAGRRLKDIRDLADIKGPYMPLLRRGDYHHTGYHDLADAPGQLRRLNKAGDVYDPTNPDHKSHEFNTYEFADETTARPFIEGSDFKAQNTGERLVRKTTGKVESVPQPKRHAEVRDAAGNVVVPENWETNYGGKNEIHATRAAAVAARDAHIAANYDKRVHTTLQNKEVNFYQNAVDLEMGRRETEATPGFNTTEAGHRPYEKQQGLEDMSDEIRSVREAMEKSTTFSQLPAADQKVMRDVLAHHSIRVLGGTRVQSRRLPRRNVLGASEDLAHNFADYAYSNAGYVAKLEYGPHVSRVVDAMKHDVKINGADKHAFMRSAVMNEFDKRADQVAPPNNDGIFGKTVNRLLQLSFLKRLASPAFHAINATEPWMIGLPYLAGEYGMMKSAGYLARAYNAIGGRDIAWQGIKETGKAFTGNDSMDFSGRIIDKFAPGSGEQKMLNHLRDRGMLGADAGMELAKLNVANATMLGRGFDRADHVARQMGQAQESINRTVMGLAAYWAAKEKHKHLSEAEIHEKVVEALDNTMGTYDRWNAPPIFNHPLGRMALQFHKYGQRQYYLLGKMIGGSLKGDNKLQNAKSLGLMMGTHFIMAGALGLPTEPITMAINVANSMGLTSATSDDFNNAIRETLAAHFGKEIGQVTSTGVASYFGLDLNSRLGLNQLLGPNGAPKSHKAEDIFSYYAKWLAGSAPGMVTEYLSGLGDIAEGKWDDAAAKLAPFKIAGDSAKSFKGYFTGKTSDRGRDQGGHMTGFEAAAQVFGIAPSRLKEEAAAKNVIYRGTQDYSKDRTSLSGAWVGAKSSKDERLAWDAVQRFNAQQTSANAKITMSDLYKLRRAAKREEAQATARGLPSGARYNKRVPEVSESARATYNY